MMSLRAQIGDLLSNRIFHPFWDMKDKSIRLKTLKELEESQWMNAEERNHIISRKIKQLLIHAYESTRYYKEIIDVAGIDLERFELLRDIRKIPLLTKNDVRNRTEDMLSNKYQRISLLKAKTGGSTGTSLEVWIDKKCEERRKAAAIRSDRWAGWEVGYQRGALWGNPKAPDSLKRKVRMLFLDRVIVLDTITMNNASMHKFCSEIKSHNIKHLFGHAHSLYIFADYCKTQGYNLAMRSIVVTSMMLLENERVVIEDVFQCAVQNRYGCEEVSLIASECEQHEGLHINTDHVYVELLNEKGEDAIPGQLGRIVVTDLINYGMPFIRYEIGDYGVESGRLCTCGRNMPILDKVVGRVADFLKKKNGTKVSGISLIERTVTKTTGIKQLQIIQDSIDCFIVNVVKDSGFSEKSGSDLAEEFTRVFGDISLTINFVDFIKQEANGKYRFSICNI